MVATVGIAGISFYVADNFFGMGFSNGEQSVFTLFVSFGIALGSRHLYLAASDDRNEQLKKLSSDYKNWLENEPMIKDYYKHAKNFVQTLDS